MLGGRLLVLLRREPQSIHHPKNETVEDPWVAFAYRTVNLGGGSNNPLTLTVTNKCTLITTDKQSTKPSQNSTFLAYKTAYVIYVVKCTVTNPGMSHSCSKILCVVLSVS
jgi:hypothetical protein